MPGTEEQLLLQEAPAGPLVSEGSDSVHGGSHPCLSRPLPPHKPRPGGRWPLSAHSRGHGRGGTHPGLRETCGTSGWAPAGRGVRPLRAGRSRGAGSSTKTSWISSLSHRTWYSTMSWAMSLRFSSLFILSWVSVLSTDQPRNCVRDCRQRGASPSRQHRPSSVRPPGL